MGKANRLYPCPCCGYLSFDEPPGSYMICPICFWEDSAVQLRYVLSASGPNKVSLFEAQQNYARYGAMEKRLVDHVRLPRASDKRDPAWRPLDPQRDTMMASPHADPVSAFVETATKQAGNETLYYYWRPAVS